MDEKSQSKENYDTNKKTPKAAAYMRVSSTRQEEEGYSLDAQYDRIKEFVDSNGWELQSSLEFKEKKPATKVENYRNEELGLIESFSDRPKLTELLTLAQKKAFQHLVIYSRDRLSRVVEDTIALELFLQRCGVKIHYVKQGEDFDSNSGEIGRLLHIVFTSLAQMEGELLSSRVKDGGRACVGKGRWPGGKIPLGYLPVIHTNNSSDKKKWHTTLKKSEFDSELIKEVFNLYNSGLGYRRIAENMNKKYGFIKWSKGKIEAIIKNQTYTGSIFWDRRGGRRNPRRHNSKPIYSPEIEENIIISNELWEETLNERENRNKIHDAYYHNTSFILKDKLVCPRCNKIMKTKNRGVNKSSVYTCFTTKAERLKCDVFIPSRLVENEFKKHMKKTIFTIQDIDTFWGIYKEKYDDKISKLTDMKEEIEEKVNKCNEFNLKVKERHSKEVDFYIKEALHTQIIISDDLINKYNMTLDIINKKLEGTRKSKQELGDMVRNFLPSIFISHDNVELTRLRREFIINFIDKVFVSYDEENREVIFKKIEFIPPELI